MRFYQDPVHNPYAGSPVGPDPGASAAAVSVNATTATVVLPPALTCTCQVPDSKMAHAFP